MNLFVTLKNKRNYHYILVTILLLITFILSQTYQWSAHPEIHTILEILSTLLALIISALAFIRYASQKNITILFVGITFLFTSLLDAYHTILTSTSLTPITPFTAPWSWNATRTFPAIFLTISIAHWFYYSKNPSKTKPKDNILFLLAFLITFISFLFYNSRPRPDPLNTTILRPEELLPTLFFTIALFGYLIKNTWQSDHFEHWLIISLIINIFAQFAVLSSSPQGYDLQFIIAHILKLAGYTSIFIGILFNLNITLKQVTDSDQQLNNIIQSASDAIITIDQNQTILLFNTAAENIFGYTSNQAIGKPLTYLMPQRFRDNHQNHISSFGTTGKTIRTMTPITELAGLHADGTEFPIDASISRTTINNQHLYTVILRDITLQRQMEKDLQDQTTQLNNIIQSASDAIITINQNQTILLFNAAAENIFGYPADQVVGKPLTSLMPQRFRDNHHNHVSSFGTTGKTIRSMMPITELVALKADGSEFPIDASISRTTINDQHLYTVILRDMTLQRQLEKEIKDRNQELESYAFIVSHDLRAPLRALVNYSRFLVEDAGDKLDEDDHENIEGIVENAERMNTLILDLLEYSRVGYPKTAPTTVKIEIILSKIISDLTPVQQTALTIPQDLPTIYAHRTHIEQIFSNLISNALKYAKPDTPPKITLTHKELPQHWQFTLQDNGIGIEEQHYKKIFDMFSRLHTQEVEGTGIGLAIVKKAVETHGGEIHLSSTPGKGTTFTFTISKQLSVKEN